MPIIEAMLVTNTDISIVVERKKMTAPVTITATKPSASGNAAAASEPNAAIRISATIGNPVISALSRSSLESSCSPAQAVGWPTRYGVTPSTVSPGAMSSRSSTAASICSETLAVAWIEHDGDALFAELLAGGRRRPVGQRQVLDARRRIRRAG